MAPESWWRSLETCSPSLVETIVNHMRNHIAEKIHISWSEHYQYWRDSTPWTRTDALYYKPYTPVGDEKRNQQALAAYADLPQEEQNKDLVIASFLIREVTSILGIPLTASSTNTASSSSAAVDGGTAASSSDNDHSKLRIIHVTLPTWNSRRPTAVSNIFDRLTVLIMSKNVRRATAVAVLGVGVAIGAYTAPSPLVKVVSNNLTATSICFALALGTVGWLGNYYGLW